MQLETPQLKGTETLPDLIEYLARLQKSLQFLLSGRLSTDNIRELSAEKITPGMISNVPIKINLADNAYIQIDLTGLDISNGVTINLEADEHGEVTFRGTINTTKAATMGDLMAANANVQTLQVGGQDVATKDVAGYALSYDSGILTLENGYGEVISTAILA